jgi:hypothetical protein
MNDLDEVDLFKNDNDFYEPKESYYKANRKFTLNLDQDFHFNQENKYEGSSLIKDLEDKWEQIENNKRVLRGSTKRTMNETKQMENKFKDSSSSLKINYSTSALLASNISEARLKSIKKKKKALNDESTELDDFINCKIKQLERFRREHNMSHGLLSFHNKPTQNNDNKIFEKTGHNNNEIVRDTNIKQSNQRSESKTRSFLKKEEELNTKQTGGYNYDNNYMNIDELIAPSKTLISKMQGVYGLIAKEDNKEQDCEGDPSDDNQKQYSLYSLEKNFEDIVNKINPNLKVKKNEYEFTNKRSNNHGILNIINENTKHLRDDSVRKEPVKVNYHNGDRVYSKNNFDNVNGKMSLIGCSKLKKLLDLNK